MKIGVVLPISEADGVTPSYAAIRSYAQRAEQAGFDSVWVFDHLLFRRPDDPATRGIWECWTVLTALAEATRQVEIGTVVLCVPFRNPALLAKMAVTLDEVSGGRLILGLGAGWHQPEFDAFGYPFDHLASRFEEGLQIIAPLLRTGAVDFEGQYATARDCAIVPRGPRPAGPPILIASFGPRMLRLTAEHADLWNTAWFGTVDGVAESRAALEQACVAVGRDPATVEVTVGVTVVFPEDGQEPPAPDKALSGDTEALVRELRRYEQAGIAHLICSVAPRTEAALERFAEAVRQVRAG
jgi:probable F420-dependent oxidoreductase